MAKKLLSIKLDCDLIKRLEALIPYITKNKELVAIGMNITRSTAIRLALLEGVKVLEHKHDRDCGEDFR